MRQRCIRGSTWERNVPGDIWLHQHSQLTFFFFQWWYISTHIYMHRYLGPMTGFKPPKQLSVISSSSSKYLLNGKCFLDLSTVEIRPSAYQNVLMGLVSNYVGKIFAITTGPVTQPPEPTKQPEFHDRWYPILGMSMLFCYLHWWLSPLY